jgi:FtsH-binding integral membrane protein
MPWYGFIHPLLAVATVWLGLVTAQTSLSKISDWDFPLRRQRGRTIVFFMLCIANFAVGLFVNVALRDIHKGVKITGHVPLSVIVLVAAFLAALVTFARSRPGETPPLMRWHAVLSIAALAVILTMGFLGALNLF